MIFARSCTTLKGPGLLDMFNRGEPCRRSVCLQCFTWAHPAIVAALQRVANIIITRRIVDSALVSGPLIHEFGLGLG